MPGVRVGHATAAGGETGCTVVLGPFRAAVEVRGLATGTRELGPLDPHHLVPQAHGIVLSGGSAFGLSTADGVMAWLEEGGVGFDTGVARVPIVPAAVIFDLAPGRARPDAAVGREACEAASDAPVQEGRVGVGAGASVGHWLGPQGASPGGLGGLRGLVHVRAILSGIGTHVVPAQFALGGAHEAFNPDGSMADPAKAKAVRAVVDATVRTAARLKG